MADLCEVTEEEFFTQADEELMVKEMKMGEEIPNNNKKTSEIQAGNVYLLYAIMNAKIRKYEGQNCRV